MKKYVITNRSDNRILGTIKCSSVKIDRGFAVFYFGNMPITRLDARFVMFGEV